MASYAGVLDPPDVETPSRRADNAIQAKGRSVLGGGDVDYYAYFWWEKGYLWCEIVPINGAPYLTGLFSTEQNGLDTDSLWMYHLPSNEWYSGTVRSPTIFYLHDYDDNIGTADLDFSKDFLLWGGLEIIGNEPVTIPGNSGHRYHDNSDGGSGGGGGCFIECLYSFSNI